MRQDEFVIKHYDQNKTFASFLPGIAGVHGIPLWAHYTNRAQAITSFGLRDKNGCILEFYPANTAYRIVDRMGFRTFLKIDGKVVEAFSPRIINSERVMYISKESVRIEENTPDYKISVKYFILPNENIGGLVRRVKITPKSNFDLEILDGLTQLLPTDANEWMLKHQSNLLKSWADVKILDSSVAFYFETSIPADTAEVKSANHGNYYLAVKDGKTLAPLYDMNNIFGFDTSLSRALCFEEEGVEKILSKVQVAEDKVSGGFCGFKEHAKKNQEISFDVLIGYTDTKEFILNKLDAFKQKGYFDQKERDAKNLLDDLTSDIDTSSALNDFDQYMRQNYLDNLLRGGIPYSIDTKSKHFTYHIYSRRHGDMEREYNFFSIAPEFYSQGNGNFRDVCQNRRSDTIFHPEVGSFNAKMFASLIGMDGYNPLGVLGVKFNIPNKEVIPSLVNRCFEDKDGIMLKHLSETFTPGSIANLAEKEFIKYKVSEIKAQELIFEEADVEVQAEFGEGYWVDHWTYILDLFESLEAVLPDKMEAVLFDEYVRYYNSPITVLPRSKKYVINTQGKVRQYGALLEPDNAKRDRLHMGYGSNWFKYLDKEEFVTANLYTKLLMLATCKFSLLDPLGIGISMEANKPGWNDAMNGLPGLFASGVSEAIELARLVIFLDKYLPRKSLTITLEQKELIESLFAIYKDKSLSDFDRWDKIQNSVEAFRDKTRYGSLGDASFSDISKLIHLMKETLDKGIKKALKIGEGIMPTFLAYEATSFEKLGEKGYGDFDLVKVNGFELKPLPYFLEAPARSFKYLNDKDALKKQYDLIKSTELYDDKLKMYKTSVSLDNESIEIGRIRAFQKGWLERESNFLHMTYKYLLGLLKAGLYDEFYEEIKTNFTCFMDKDVYGRSIYENSSFIATSNNPDPFVHGEGFVARLSGSTAEAINMWCLMMEGASPFVLEDGILKLNLKPLLKGYFFKRDGTLSFKFLSKIKVTYHNEKRIDTFDMKIYYYLLDGKKYESIDGHLAKKVREGVFKTIDVFLK